MSWQHGGWQRRQQEGGGGGTDKEEEEDMWKNKLMLFWKSHTGDKAICPDGLFVLAKSCTVGFYWSSLFLLRNTDATIARSGFGPYHGLWLYDAPTKYIGIIPTQWTMMH